MRNLIKILVVMLFVSSCASSQPVKWTPGGEGEYPLDNASRSPNSCPNVETVQHPGMFVNYSRPVKVNPYFSEQLLLFEQLLLQVAVHHFDSNAVTIRHYGAFNCRRIRGRNKLSEHAFANAIDISGFDIHDGDDVIKIRLKKHWWTDSKQANFLHDLAQELAMRPDIFRGMLGPGDPAHEDHFHFDMGRHRYSRISIPN